MMECDRMQKLIVLILCGVVMFCGFRCGTICGTDGDVVRVDICGNEYGFYGDGFADGESVTVFMIGEEVRGAWHK